MEKLYDYLPQQLVTFILVTLFSLLIGLSQRRISLKREGETTLFGTDRTFTFIGILGYLLYILDPKEMHLFMGGGIILGMLLGINYYVKQSQFHVFGVTTIIIALITYCMAPIISTQPSWFYVMMVVTVLLFTEMKHTFTELVQRMQNDDDHTGKISGYQRYHFAHATQGTSHTGYQSHSIHHLAGYCSRIGYLLFVLLIIVQGGSQ